MTEEEAKNIVKETLTEINNNYHGDYCLFKAVHDLNERVTKLENEIKETGERLYSIIGIYNNLIKTKEEEYRSLQNDIEEWFIDKYMPNKKKTIIERILSIFK